MTHDLGRRVAHYRRQAGITSTAALAELIGNPRITDSVLRNIESGRRADLSVSQLLEIAAAIGVPPAALLVAVDHPLEPIEIAGTGPQFDDMPSWRFDAWFSAGAVPLNALRTPFSVRSYMGLYSIRQAVEEVLQLQDAQEELAVLRSGRHRAVSPEHARIGGEEPTVEELEEEIRSRTSRLHSLRRSIAGAGFDASWIPSAETADDEVR